MYLSGLSGVFRGRRERNIEKKSGCFRVIKILCTIL